MDNGVTGALYLKSHSGIFKILQIVFSLCSLISMQCATTSWGADPFIFFNLTCIFCLVYSFIILVASLLGAGPTSWTKVDLMALVVLAIFAFISAALFTAGFKIWSDALKAAIVFQYFNGLVYFGNVAVKILT